MPSSAWPVRAAGKTSEPARRLSKLPQILEGGVGPGHVCPPASRSASSRVCASARERNVARSWIKTRSFGVFATPVTHSSFDTMPATGYRASAGRRIRSVGAVDVQGDEAFLGLSDEEVIRRLDLFGGQSEPPPDIKNLHDASADVDDALDDGWRPRQRHHGHRSDQFTDIRRRGSPKSWPANSKTTTSRKALQSLSTSVMTCAPPS